MSTTSWEPWTPTIGQRVRVRLSGECQYRPHIIRVPSLVCLGPATSGGHPPELDRAVGHIIRSSTAPMCRCADRPPDEDPHRYAVELTPWVYSRDGLKPCMGAYFAAIELEPICARCGATLAPEQDCSACGAYRGKVAIEAEEQVA